MITAADQQLMDNLARWREDVVAFVREFFGAEPDAWQCRVLEQVPKRMRIAMKACKGPGKSTVDAWIAWWCLVVWPHPKMVATSITEDNLKDGLWAEMSKWQQQNEFLKKAYVWTAERIYLEGHKETWFLSARNWPKGGDPGQQANTLAGIHADFVMFIVDEAGGIPDAVVAAAEAGLANAMEERGTKAWLILSGNPTHLEGPLYRACTSEKHLWYVEEISSAPDDPLRTPRVSKEWAQQQIDKYGADSPFVLVNVFGKFPPGQSNTLIGRDTAQAASERQLIQAAFVDEPVVLGVDVARFGDDESVCIKRQGRMAYKPNVYRNMSLMELADQVVLQMLAEPKPVAVMIDETGVGAGVVDRLRQLGHQVVGVNFGSKATKAEPRLANKRAEMWWDMGEWLKQAAIPKDPQLVDELCAPTYWFDKQERVVLESKDDMKARGASSPNKADALACTFAAPVARQSIAQQARREESRRKSLEYDPYGG